MKRKIFRPVVVGAVLFLGVAHFANAQFDKQPYCIVMPGHRVKEKFFVDYKGERIYFCCRSCVKAFKKHPKKYWARLLKEEAPS